MCIYICGLFTRVHHTHVLHLHDKVLTGLRPWPSWCEATSRSEALALPSYEQSASGNRMAQASRIVRSSS